MSTLTLETVQTRLLNLAAMHYQIREDGNMSADMARAQLETSITAYAVATDQTFDDASDVVHARCTSVYR